MNPSQSDLMTMESFQMNGGNAFGYDTQEYADPACTARPGNFREDSSEQHYDLNNTGSRQGSEDGFSEAPTAFVYANEKRFNDFHTLFRSVPEDEKLIEGNPPSLNSQEQWRQHTPPPLSLSLSLLSLPTCSIGAKDFIFF